MSENNLSHVPVPLTLRERFRLHYLVDKTTPLSAGESRESSDLMERLNRFTDYYYDTMVNSSELDIKSIDQAVIRRHTHTRNPHLQPIQELIDTYRDQSKFPDSFEFAMDPNAHHILQDLADEHENHPAEQGESELQFINRRHTEEIHNRQLAITRQRAIKEKFKNLGILRSSFLQQLSRPANFEDENLPEPATFRNPFSVPEPSATLQLDANNQITTPIAPRRSRRRQNQIQAPPAPVRRSQRRRLNIQQEEEKEREEKKQEEKE